MNGADQSLRSRSRVSRRLACSVAILPILLGAMAATLGCGAGNGFTGGSIPTGGTRLVGNVVAAENTLTPIANANISVQVLGPQALPAVQTTSAVDGRFLLPSIPIAKGSTSTLRVTVTAPASAGRQPQAVTYSIADLQTADMVVSLPRASVDVNAATSLTIDALPKIPPQGNIPVNARLRDKSGAFLPYAPTLLLLGNIGTLGPDETFSGAITGNGAIYAYWYQLPVASAKAIVDPTAVELPPSPPSIPGGGSGDKPIVSP